MAGVKDTDAHIEFFWNSMESFSQVGIRLSPLRVRVQKGNALRLKINKVLLRKCGDRDLRRI